MRIRQVTRADCPHCSGTGHVVSCQRDGDKFDVTVRHCSCVSFWTVDPRAPSPYDASQGGAKRLREFRGR